MTHKESCRNTPRNHLLTLDGKTQCIAAWAEELDISDQVLYARSNKLKWSDHATLTTPIKKQSRDHNPRTTRIGTSTPATKVSLLPGK